MNINNNAMIVLMVSDFAEVPTPMDLFFYMRDESPTSQVNCRFQPEQNAKGKAPYRQKDQARMFQKCHIIVSHWSIFFQELD